MNLGRILVLLNTLILAFFGVYGLVAPESFMRDLIACTPDNLSATIEIQAMYGGLELGAAFLSAYTLTRPELLRWGLLLILALIGGLGAGRALGFLVHGVGGTTQMVALTAEWLFAGLSIYCLNCESKRTQS